MSSSTRHGGARTSDGSTASAAGTSPIKDGAARGARGRDDGPLRPRRQPRWIVAGALLTCLGGLGSAVVFQQATHSHSVVVVTKAVSRGTRITAADLGVTSVGQLTGVQTVPADDLRGLVGQQAVVDLSPGLLPVGAVGEVGVPEGRVQLGLKLPPGRIPAGPLPAGTHVLLVSVPAPGETGRAEASDGAGSARENEASAGPVAVFEAVVVSAPQLGHDGVTYQVDVHLARFDAEAVAVLAATDRLALVRGS